MDNNAQNTVTVTRVTHKRPSAVPIWSAAAIWFAAAFTAPVSKLSVILLIALISFLTAFTARRFAHGETETIELPFSSGDERLDGAVAALDNAQEKLTANAAEIINVYPETGRTLNETAATLAFIRSELIKDGDSVKRLRRLFDYYLPTELKLAGKYVEMAHTKKAGENSMNTFLSIEKALAQLNTAFKKQYDALFQDDFLDAETDLSVLETMLKQDNLD